MIIIKRAAILLSLFAPLFWGHAQASAELPFQVPAAAAILGDIDSGAILFSQDAETQLPPASLTKVMTLYIIYEALRNGELRLTDELPVSERAWRTSGSKTFVKVGDRVKVEDLTRGIAVQSGNDACIVIAEHLAGSEEGFAEIMNNKARDLGMASTHFENATGLPGDTHLSTAHDLFRLASAIIRDFPQYAHFSQERQYTFNGILQRNRNRLLWKDSTVTGLKTGHTNAAGYCLIATNEKDGQRLSAVILGASSPKVREAEALRLLRYGNRAFETLRLFEAGASVKQLRVWKGATQTVEAVINKPVILTIPRKERGNLEVGLSYKDPVMAPVAQGERLGTLVVKLGQEELVKMPVVSAAAVPEGNLFETLQDSLRLRFGW